MFGVTGAKRSIMATDENNYCETIVLFQLTKHLGLVLGLDLGLGIVLVLSVASRVTDDFV